MFFGFLINFCLRSLLELQAIDKFCVWNDYIYFNVLRCFIWFFNIKCYIDIKQELNRIELLTSSY